MAETSAVLDSPKASPKPLDSIKAMMAPAVPGVSATPPEKIVEKTLTLQSNPEVKAPEAPKKPEGKTAEAPPVTDKPAVPAIKESDEFEKTLTGKSKDRFNHLATERAQVMAEEMAAKRADELLVKRLAEMPKIDPETAKRIEELEKRALDGEARLRTLGIEQSPEFIQQFVERPKAIKTELSTILDDAGIAKDEFLLHLEKYSDKASKAKLNELLEEIGPLDRAQAFGLITEYLKIDRDKQSVIIDPDTAEKILKEEHQTKVKAFVEKLTTERDGAVKATLPAFRKDAPHLFEGEAGEIFAKDFDAKVEQTNRLDLEQFPPALRAQLIGSALMTKPLIEKVNAQAEEIVQLRAQVDGFQKGVPGLGTGLSRPANGTEEGKKDVLGSAEESLGFKPGSMPRRRDRF